MLSLHPAVAMIAALAISVTGCGRDPEAPGSTAPPQVGECRALEPDDILQPTNDSPAVACSKPHTAETFWVGTVPDEVSNDGADDAALAAYAESVCDPGFRKFLGGDESTVKRSTLTWVWFRPSDARWEQGDRWLRCDVIGGGEQSKKFVNLPATAEGILQGRPEDRWMTCAEGPTVAGSVKVPCNEPHDWRAISTVVLGDADDPYPGDRAVETKTRQFCSDQVAAYLNYPVADYDFGYTWFKEREWQAGNRRSVCWAQTDR